MSSNRLRGRVNFVWARTYNLYRSNQYVPTMFPKYIYIYIYIYIYRNQWLYYIYVPSICIVETVWRNLCNPPTGNTSHYLVFGCSLVFIILSKQAHDKITFCLIKDNKILCVLFLNLATCLLHWQNKQTLNKNYISLIEFWYVW